MLEHVPGRDQIECRTIQIDVLGMPLMDFDTALSSFSGRGRIEFNSGRFPSTGCRSRGELPVSAPNIQNRLTRAGPRKTIETTLVENAFARLEGLEIAG